MLLRLCQSAFLFCFLWLPTAAAALPEAVLQQAGGPLQEVGSGRYTKLGFTIYRATLWTASGKWNPREPYALQLRYARSLSQTTLVNAVVDGIDEQNVADEETLTRWGTQLKQTLPAVEEDDELIGLAMPGSDSRLYFNGTFLFRLEEQAFSDAFFNIWFGVEADAELRAALLDEVREEEHIPAHRLNRRRKDPFF